MSTDGWYWCLTHSKVERWAEGATHERLGPYATPEDARSWRERHEARDENWEAQDKEWENRRGRR